MKVLALRKVLQKSQEIYRRSGNLRSASVIERVDTILSAHDSKTVDLFLKNLEKQLSSMSKSQVR